MMLKKHLLLAFLVLFSTEMFAQITETFTKRWETSFGEFSNHVAADPRNEESFYAAFEARKLQGDIDYYSVLAKYGCTGEVLWRVGLESPAGDERLVDMAVLSSGEVGILQEVGNDELYLHWISRGGVLNTTLRIDLPAPSNAWELLPHPNASSFLITMAYDINNQSQLALLHVNENGDQLSGYLGEDIASGPLGEWHTADDLVLKTGRDIQIINLNTAQVSGFNLPDANIGEGDLYKDGDDIYLTYIESGGEDAHVVKVNQTTVAWHKVIQSTAGFEYVKIENTLQGDPALMLETGRNGAEVFFAALGADGNGLRVAKVNDAEFISYLGDFDVDENDKWLYCGSELNMGVDDFSARLDFESNCVSSANLNMIDGSSMTANATFQDLEPLDFMISSVSLVEYVNFPPEDYLCRPGIESLSQIFRDTVVCDSVLVFDHDLSGNYMFNGMPIPDPIIIREEGIYQVSFQSCNTTDRVNFNVEFVDCECQFHFPNVFTPNGDNLNDVFQPEGQCNHTAYSMLIYDRWSNLVFESRNRFVGWDGTFNEREANPGVYTYIIRFTPLPSNEERIEIGTITLIR